MNKHIKDFIQILVISFFVFSLTLSSIIILGKMMFSLEDFVNTEIYNKAEEFVKEDYLLNTIVDACDTHESTLRKVTCIVETYDKNYVYKTHDSLIRPTSIFFQQGGVCRDFAVNVCSALETINVTCKYVFPEGHVFPMIEWRTEKERWYCLYDGEWNCKTVKNG